VSSSADPLTSIPVHTSTLRLLQALKTGAQNWDQFLLESFEDFLPPETLRELGRRTREPDVLASKVYAQHKKLLARGR
jgi:hypothetical protein